MKELIFGFASNILQMNLRDPHDIPFALPLMLAAGLGFILGFIFIQLVGNEQRQQRDD
ncbi:hypothetical protein PL263_00305 [Methylomonas sp. EFPC3]|uniref:hypothetical protein n=1 Tax=Methylomonas TaxID=416 RepID=UPI001642F5B2|nr:MULTISPECIES: hypothetical protein [Methylomonas]WFP50482.1 hypothetical protein PL263_00305 [Methylomonas sp. EFPC3]